MAALAMARAAKAPSAAEEQAEQEAVRRDQVSACVAGHSGLRSAGFGGAFPAQ